MKSKTGKELERLLDYELKQSTRHRQYASLVMLTANGKSYKLIRMLRKVVREADSVFSLAGSMAVLMGETDTDGAQKAIERYRKIIGDIVKVKYAVASFPKDGKGVGELIDASHRRLDFAKASDARPVVAEG